MLLHWMLLTLSALLSPAMSATLGGAVLNEAGDPLAGVDVIAYDQRLNYGTATTTTDGSWSMDFLPAGRYRVRAMPGETSIYTDRFYPSDWDFCSATALELAEGSTTEGVDVTLPEGGVLTGTLRDLAGAALEGAEVYAQGTESRTALGARSAVTDAAGAFTIAGLDADVGGPTDWQCYVALDGFPRQWLGGAYSEDEAEIYSVALPGEEPNGTAAGDHALLDGIRVTGLISGDDGAGGYAPVSGGYSYVYSPSQVITAEIGADGVYTADGLPPGEVISWATVSGFATTYWPGSDRPTDERVSAPDEGMDVTADLDLPRGSVLTLQFTDATGAGSVGEMSALLYNDEHTVGRGGPVDADGSMVIDGLWPGVYDLYVYGADGGFEDGYAFEGTSVTADTTLTIAVALGASITGRLTDDAGAPVYGGYVYAFPADDPDESYATVADSDGAYSIAGLPAGFYSIRASYVHYCASDPGFVTTWWQDARSEDWAAQTQLLQGQAATNVDFTLPNDDDHDAMGDDWERGNALDAARDDSNEDPDSDGFTNLEEYLLGSDPNGPNGGSGIGCAGCASGGNGAAPFAQLVGGVAILLGARRQRYASIRGR
ncbi:MAG: carboxypeptidase regulatory-like domain-containing protein [Myxococcales bacterium]|nr:carboxypeptidase regulatory-like domain-containing protein [Myxococcales bacterium]